MGDYQAAARRTVNHQRDAHHVSTLVKQGCVQAFARRQARKMATEQKVWHQDLSSVRSSCGVGATAENLAYGFPTGRKTVLAWMDSWSHRANILNGTHQYMGLAARRGSNGAWYVCLLVASKQSAKSTAGDPAAR
ncbi:CAP domain-containing protein [Nocardioides acrostichi]|uniref:CAP domain-containing protein n=1 Tax=Nocardioides acrostichi TaxID=2784339 RepID=A0A930Y6G6_9ACTN|nr:CAP domain-containing protein [Nocardioides acrostichi]MBF4162335.1 CAP domain-containing protein [Nocardioides acrostichi]